MIPLGRVMQEILLNVESKEIRYAHLKNGLLHDLIIERKKTRQIAGNIYRGRVTNILHNIQSAFIDINEGENGFIHISDILENTQKFQERFSMDFEIDFDVPEELDQAPKEEDINQILRVDQPVLVQVVKEPIGTKGARLTSNISLAGRFLVLLPNTPHRGVSRKIDDPKARERLKKLIRAFEMPVDMGIICRTASIDASTEILIEEANDLLKFWQEIVAKFHKAHIPTCLYEESDLFKRTILTAVDKKMHRVLIDDYKTYQYCKKIHEKYSEEHPLRLEYYRDKAPMFERFNVEREIDKALKRKIWLPSGGYLFFDRTEAMHTIDVNSGRSKQQRSTKDVEEALVHINLEAAEEIARQLRLRNIGGLIICDFIDMRFRRNQRRVLDRLKESMREDDAKCTILAMSEFGLVEMTRQRHRESLDQTLLTACPYCSGQGEIKTHETVAIEIERAIKKVILTQEQYGLELITHPRLDHYLRLEDTDFLFNLSDQLHAHLKFKTNDQLHLNDFEFYSSIDGHKIDV